MYNIVLHCYQHQFDGAYRGYYILQVLLFVGLHAKLEWIMNRVLSGCNDLSCILTFYIDHNFVVGYEWVSNKFSDLQSFRDLWHSWYFNPNDKEQNREKEKWSSGYFEPIFILVSISHRIFFDNIGRRMFHYFCNYYYYLHHFGRLVGVPF